MSSGVEEITIRFSELQTLMRCALQHRVVWAHDLKPPSVKENLLRGSAMHAVLEGHYKTLKAMDDAGVPRSVAAAYEGAWAQFNKWQAEEAEGKISESVMDELIWMYGRPGEGYIGCYGVDPNFSKIYTVENHRIVLLLDEVEVLGQKWRVWLRVTADLVTKVENLGGKVLLVDHKTAKGRDVSKEAFGKENELDPQRKIYTASLKLKDAVDAGSQGGAERLPIWSAYHNSIRVEKLKRAMSYTERFARHPVYYNDLALENAWSDAQKLAVAAIEIRMGGGIQWASPDPMNCRMCDLKGPHLLSSSTGRPLTEVVREYGWRTSAEKLAAGELVDEDSGAFDWGADGGF